MCGCTVTGFFPLTTGMAAVNKFLNDNPDINVYYGVRGPIAPVMKNVRIGERGGLSYENSKGKRVYLKRSQRARCELGTLNGAGATCKGIVRSERRRQHSRRRRVYGGYVSSTVMPASQP